MKIGKFEFEASIRPIHFAFLWRKARFTSFPLFAAHLFPSSRQAGLIVFGFYFIVGQCMPLESAPLTEEEKAMLVEDNENEG